MPYNIVEQNRASTQSGLALGRAMFDNALRAQQLKSQQELQQLEMRQRAEQLRWLTMQHQMAIQEQADNQKRSVEFMARVSPVMPLPEGYTGPPQANPLYEPDMGKAYIETFLPGSRDPSKVLLNGAQLQLRQAQAVDEQAMAAARGQPRPLTPQDAALKEAQTGLARARTEQVQKGAAYAPTDVMKNLQALADAERKGDRNSITSLRRKLELDGLSEVDMLKFRSELRSLDNNILMDVAEKERQRATIYEKYDRLATGGRASTPAPNPTEEETVIVVDPQGRKGRIPRRNLEKAIQRGYKEYEG